MNLSNMLKGIGGEPELVRTLGAVGVAAYIVSGISFQAWNMIRGVPFDVVAFCTAFPAGLAVAIGAAAGAVAIKDKAVAGAKVTEAHAGASQ